MPASKSWTDEMSGSKTKISSSLYSIYLLTTCLYHFILNATVVNPQDLLSSSFMKGPELQVGVYKERDQDSSLQGLGSKPRRLGCGQGSGQQLRPDWQMCVTRVYGWRRVSLSESGRTQPLWWACCGIREEQEILRRPAPWMQWIRDLHWGSTCHLAILMNVLHVFMDALNKAASRKMNYFLGIILVKWVAEDELYFLSGI